MDQLSAAQEAVLATLDEEIAKLERKLAKVQPYINELQRLKQTRRVLLNEKGTTSGSGASNRAQITQEEVITVMRDNPDGVTPAHISERLGVDGTVVRSHINRHKGTTYRRNDDGLWQYIGAEESNDE